MICLGKLHKNFFTKLFILNTSKLLYVYLSVRMWWIIRTFLFYFNLSQCPCRIILSALILNVEFSFIFKQNIIQCLNYNQQKAIFNSHCCKCVDVSIRVYNIHFISIFIDTKNSLWMWQQSITNMQMKVYATSYVCQNIKCAFPLCVTLHGKKIWRVRKEIILRYKSDRHNGV